MSEVRHTPLPWRISAECNEIVVSEDSVYGVQIADCGKPAGDEYRPPPGEAAANAEFIARACNPHEGLLAALKETSEDIRRVEYSTRWWMSLDGPLLPDEWERRDPNSYRIWERAVDAIAKAEGRDV